MSDEELAARFSLSNTEGWELATVRRKLRGLEDWTKPIIPCLYRPLDVRSCYYGQLLMDRPRENEMWHTNFPNICIATGRQGQVVGSDEWNLITVGRNPADTNLFYRGGIQYFSLYLYPKNTKLSLFDPDELSNILGGRSPNLSLTFVNDVTNHLHFKFISDGRGDLQQTFGPEDIFNYMYAIFHAPSYRERYAEFLKIDFPRLPLTSNADLFRELCKLGDILVGLHLMEKFGQITTRFPIPGDYMVEKIDYTSPTNAPEQSRVWINKTQYFEGVPPEVWEFHIGGYQVCQKWLKDRKGRKLEFNDIKHYQLMVATLAETIQLMGQIDEVIDEHGGWPIK
jgi:predicted helicase